MAYFDTGQDLLRHFLRRVGQLLPTSETESDADRLLDAKLYINEAYWWVCAQHPFRWARKSPPLQFVSIAETEVTVSSIVGATVTLSATIATSMAGRKLLLDSDGIPHRISAHTAGTDTLTLVTAYTGDATSGAGRIFQDELTVATDILAFPDLREVQTGSGLVLISEGEMRARFPTWTHGIAQGQRYGAFISDSVLRLVPWTADARLFECAYNVRPDPLDFAGGATDTPIVPRHFRPVIAWRAEQKLAADRRDEPRVKQAKAETDELLLTMKTATLTFERPRAWVPRGHRISG